MVTVEVADVVGVVVAEVDVGDKLGDSVGDLVGAAVAADDSQGLAEAVGQDVLVFINREEEQKAVLRAGLLGNSNGGCIFWGPKPVQQC